MWLNMALVRKALNRKQSSAERHFNPTRASDESKQPLRHEPRVYYRVITATKNCSLHLMLRRNVQSEVVVVGLETMTTAARSQQGRNVSRLAV